MNVFWSWLSQALGLGWKPELLTFPQLIWRALIIFGIALVLMRVGHKRSLTRRTAFDMAFIVIIGAILARAINGSAPFFGTIGISCLLVALHRLFAFIASRSPGFERLIKGTPVELVQGGERIRKQMRRHDITDADLEEDMHLSGHTSCEQIAVARLERSGDISFAKK